MLKSIHDFLGRRATEIYVSGDQFLCIKIYACTTVLWDFLIKRSQMALGVDAKQSKVGYTFKH